MMPSASSLILLPVLALQVVVLELAALALAQEAHRLVRARGALVPGPRVHAPFLKSRHNSLLCLRPARQREGDALANGADVKQLSMRSESANKSGEHPWQRQASTGAA